MSRKGQGKASLPGTVIAAIALLTLAGTIFFGYPTVYPVTRGDTEIVPLELIDNEKTYIQLKNKGLADVAITVNFSSDGSIHFKNDKGQITDSYEVRYLVAKTIR